jgi:beta-galactosidase
MNKRNLITLIFASLLAGSYAQPVLFDSDWRFQRGALKGAEAPDFDDSQWRKIDLPHDWSIENLPGTQSPFHPDAITRMSGGYTTGGTAWYRKTFNIAPEQKDKRVQIRFDGIYMNADIWLNGEHIGNHPYGYTSFWYDVTGKVRPGSDNIIAVEVKNEGLNSRWYSGSGIYRHVWIAFLNPVFIEPWGIFITTPEVSSATASVVVKTTITNSAPGDAGVKLVTRIINEQGVEAAKNETQQKINAGAGTEMIQSFTISSPELWSLESPVLYTAVTEVFSDDIPVEKTTTSFGIRSVSFDAADGFRLNGEAIELKGGCIHHDNGILGAAAIDRAEERRVELLKAQGFNAVRCSHNPPSEKFLEACDRLGMLVIDEAFDMWQEQKNPDDYHLYFGEWWERDLTSMIMRDRNHPSVILWSLGNEIKERADSSGVEIMKKFRAVINRYDPSRLLTLAVCEFWDHPGRTWDQTAPAFEMVDVGGYNYQWGQYEPDHQKFPGRIMMGTESVPIHAFQNWELVERHPYVIGDFVWTAMDYLGEAGIGHTKCEGADKEQLRPYPWFNANCGDIDLTGNKKPQSYYRDVVWRQSAIEIAVHAPLPEDCKEEVSYWGWPDEQKSWTWPGNEGDTMRVNVYSRHSAVRLELNGRIIGEKQIDARDGITATFLVPYEPGVLTATAVEEGKVAASVSIATASKPASIRLKADRQTINADRNDLSYVSVEVTDKKGNVVPNAIIPVQFSITGPGEIAASGNASPTDTSGFQRPGCITFRGRGLVILRPEGPEGKIVLKAKAPGLKPAKITVTMKKGNNL